MLSSNYVNYNKHSAVYYLENDGNRLNLVRVKKDNKNVKRKCVMIFSRKI